MNKYCFVNHQVQTFMNLFKFLAFLVFSSVGLAVVPDQEVTALHALRNSVTRSDGSAIGCWQRENVCDWCLITCNQNQTHVVGVRSNMKNTGFIPEEIGFLTELTSLSLVNSNMYGILPSSLGLLTKLKSLSLAFNSFSGSIPTTFADLNSLVVIDLSYNQLTGPLPKFIGGKNLQEVYLAKNKFTGTIPYTWFASYPSLKSCDLSYNKLSGPIPTQIDQCTSLVDLYLSRNNLNGTLPISWDKLVNLRSVDATGNDLSGTLPASLFQLPSLTYLFLDKNNFEGDLPPVSSPSPLVVIDVSKNKLSGTVPSNWFSQPELVFLYLSHNRFHGNLSDANVGDMQRLVYAYLDHNQFSGPFPSHWVSKLQDLFFLVANSNGFTGVVNRDDPVTSLHTFSLGGNQLMGDCDGPVGKSCLRAIDMDPQCVDAEGICSGDVCAQPSFHEGPSGTCSSCKYGYCYDSALDAHKLKSFDFKKHDVGFQLSLGRSMENNHAQSFTHSEIVQACTDTSRLIDMQVWLMNHKHFLVPAALQVFEEWIAEGITSTSNCHAVQNRFRHVEEQTEMHQFMLAY